MLCSGAFHSMERFAQPATCSQVSYVESTAHSLMPYQQFVDDGFLFCLHWNDLNSANQVVSEACHL